MASAMALLMFYPAPCVAKAPVDADGTRNEVMADSVASLITLVAAFIPWLVLLVLLGWVLCCVWAWRARRRAPPAA